MAIDIIQYMRPDGRPVPQTTTISDELSGAYEAMRKAGCNLAAEVLATGEISLTIENRRKGEDLDIEIVANGPDVQAGYERMLERGFWRKAV